MRIARQMGVAFAFVNVATPCHGLIMTTPMIKRGHVATAVGMKTCIFLGWGQTVVTPCACVC